MGRPRLELLPATVAVAGGAAAGLVAFAFDAPQLLVAAVALVALGSVTPAWVLATARGARLRRRLRADQVVEGERLEATIELGRGPLGMPGAVVCDPFSDSRIPLGDALAAIRGERSAEIRVAARFQRRGAHRLEPPTLTVSDPLGLAGARITGEGPPQELLVLPRTERVRWLAGDGDVRRLPAPDGSAASDALAAIDLDGLRSYRPGTPASRIHWPAVARGAGLLERRLRSDGDARPLVVLDLRTPGADEGDSVDAAVRAAASLALELAPGGCGLLLGGDQRATSIDRTLAAWPASYARLALARGGPSAPAPGLARAGARSGATIYVAAALWSRVAATLAARASGPVLLVIPEGRLAAGASGAIGVPAREALSVSGCRGFLLGSVGARTRRPAAAAGAPPR